MAQRLGTIEVDGHGRLPVTANLGYVMNVGTYVKEVKGPNGPMKVVKRGGIWCPWTAADRTRPFIEGMKRKQRDV